MSPQSSDFEELGRKVQRAQLAVEQLRGTATVDGVTVVVDAENRLRSVNVADEDAVLAAYDAAVADLKPKLDETMGELRADARVEAVSTFVEANSARLEAERVRRQREIEEEDERYYQERYRRGWLDRG
jgi:DNA-binding protein YbaB